MAPADQQNLIEQIHASGKQLLLSITGGGSAAIGSLLAVPGASASVLGAIVPYAPAALSSWLGGPVDHYCSERTARAMAMAAFQRAREFTNGDPHSLRGIGATASLATNRPKRGPHRVHVAWQSADATVAYSCELAKGQRTRADEEAIAAELVLLAVAEACEVDGGSLVGPAISNAIQRREERAPESWSQLLLGQRASASVSNDQSGSNRPSPAILFPGAFNPLHEGHTRMVQIAAERYGVPVTFEMSIANVDKPPLDFIELADRVQQLSGRHVLLTRAPTFAEKATLAPGCVFLVGIDTLHRIADTRYYGEDAARRDMAIQTIEQHGCRFLVFGRAIDGRFTNLSDLDLPANLRALCDEVPESAFRADVSSSELRTT